MMIIFSSDTEVKFSVLTWQIFLKRELYRFQLKNDAVAVSEQSQKSRLILLAF